MSERSRFWDGTALGDATGAPYDAGTEFSQVLRSMSGFVDNQGCVFVDELNKLAVTGTVTPVSVATGRALVYGDWYENDAAVSVAIATPGGATRIDRIVLRKDWTAQTVRITRIAGVEGGAAPALVQVIGTTWDFPIAKASITTGGVITVIDDRTLAGFKGIVLKTASEIVNNSSTLQNDNDLRIALPINKRVHFRAWIMYTSTAAADLKFTFTVPAGATIRASSVRNVAAGTLTKTEITASGTEFANGADGNDTTLIIEGEVLNGATAGDLQFQWAQNTATAVDTTVLAGSLLEVTPLA